MRRVTDIDWDTWTPSERATLLFVISNYEVLLIHKKRGLGAGYINGPGGRIEPGESPREAAVRETQEETGIRPLNPEACGELCFQFVDGFSIHVDVFRTEAFEGSAIETDEGIPLWTPLDGIPFDRMWEDDAYWLPLLLVGQNFRGQFVFDDKTMLDHKVCTY